MSAAVEKLGGAARGKAPAAPSLVDMAPDDAAPPPAVQASAMVRSFGALSPDRGRLVEAATCEACLLVGKLIETFRRLHELDGDADALVGQVVAQRVETLLNGALMGFDSKETAHEVAQRFAELFGKELVA